MFEAANLCTLTFILSGSATDIHRADSTRRAVYLNTAEEY